jgi:LmbE family N-acetylglucosaminyl deacetylase
MAPIPNSPAHIKSDPTVDLAVPATALAIAAHPDDVEFGCGATLAKWAAAGCRIHHLVCTDGSKGSWEPTQDTSELVAQRRAEQRAASKALGGTGEVIFLEWPDGELESGVRQRWQVCAAIRSLRPDVVLGHDPWRRYRLHPDHRNAGLLAVEGIVAARDPHFFPELAGHPHRPSSLLLWEADEADHVENVTGFAEAKIDALLAHRSQLRSSMGIDDPNSAHQVHTFAEAIRSELRSQGGHGGFDQGEAFKLIDEL